MTSDNHTSIVGNLVDDPELRFTQTGTAVANSRVAVTQRIQQDGTWRDGETSFFKVTAVPLGADRGLTHRHELGRHSRAGGKVQSLASCPSSETLLADRC
jgi:Single-strand binding protein family